MGLYKTCIKEVSMKRCPTAVLVLLVGVRFTANAQTPESGATAELIQSLLSRIQKLETRVAELEKGASTPARAEVQVQEPAPPPRMVHEEHRAPETGHAPSQSPVPRFTGFSDFNFAAT